MAANMPVVDLLKRFAQKKNATPSQIALAWLMAQKPFIVSIPATRNMDHLDENLGTLNVQHIKRRTYFIDVPHPRTPPDRLYSSIVALFSESARTFPSHSQERYLDFLSVMRTLTARRIEYPTVPHNPHLSIEQQYV
jgi:hypothetical protein